MAVLERINLLQFWMETYEKDKWKDWKDFDRRVEASGSKVELYPELMQKLAEQQHDSSAPTK